MVSFTELLGHAQCRFAIVLKKAEKIVSGDKVRLARFDHVRGELVTGVRDGRRQPEHFTRLRDSQDERLAVGRGSGKLDAAAAENKDAASRLPFNEQSRTLRISR